jgi:serine/threonine protein kinase
MRVGGGLRATSMHAGTDVQPLCTPAYAPPEVLIALESRTTIKADPAHDVWALGVIAFEAFSKVSLLSQLGVDRAMCLKLAQGQETYPWEQTQMQSDYRDSRVRSVVEACLARDAERRPSADEVCRAIKQFSI